ncbi:SapC family protein [Neptunicella sp.]|uniref:SapC family protein n=1 Tax=Neptunicella sp. TaxID=2125986 RepID=UPI003F691E67
MAANIVPLDKNRHKNFRIRKNTDFAHVANDNMVPIVANEFMHAGNNFPIVFVKEAGTAKFKCVALMGFESGENLVFNQGRVHSSYIPRNIARTPYFVGGANIEDQHASICIDENSPLVYQGGDDSDGYPLFDENGQPSAQLNEASEFLSDLITKEIATNQFVQFLVDNELLQEATLTLNLGDAGKKKLGGVYKVNEEKLNNLDDDVALSLYKKRYFAAIYSHLNSLGQIQRLVRLKAKQG